jgi:glucose-6-phosphate 1-epimerase
MAEVAQLQTRFGIPGIVRIEAGRGLLPKINVTSDLATAEIYLHGAHVTQFAPRGARPVLFLSQNSSFDAGKPIRGGIPLVFPWFGPGMGQPKSPLHGFARLKSWEIESCDLRTDGTVRIALSLGSDETTLALWPTAFSLRMIIIVGSALDITLEVKNLSTNPAQIEEALHTYLQVGDVRKVIVNGLDNLEYFDRADGGKKKKQTESPIELTGETDRAYLRTRGVCTVEDPEFGRTIKIEKSGSDVTVLWNPWVAKGEAMSDLAGGQWPTMLCVEAANALECAVTLAAGATHRMGTRISISS